jgi:dTDP-4-dehydrorhamnose 3,5-epimerase
MSMQIAHTDIPEVMILVPARLGDHRGFFSETYNKALLAQQGVDIEFVQDNHSLSVRKGVVRGLHYQVPPAAQAKLVRVVRGAVLDVAVDIRRSSPTFGRHVKEVLSAENWRQMFVPAGFAHGFLVLEPDTEVIYKVSHLYTPQHERGILWNDADLGIDWGLGEGDVILSDRDRKLPRLSETLDLF